MFSLSKLADKNFVIGFLLPVLIGAVAAAVLFRDAKTVGYIYDAILKEKSFTSLTVLVLAIWSAATLLMVWNHVIYQVLEGYIGPFNRDGWKARRRAQFMRERFELRNMHGDEEDYIGKYIKLRNTYPYREDLILPTRFGNVIRSFETYSLNVYGVDAIPAWFRLAAVIPKDFANQIDDARAEVNFWINSWAMALLFTVLAIGRFIWGVYIYLGEADFRSLSIDIIQMRWGSALSGGIAIAIAFLAYYLAIDRAREWGDLVKSAFDLYLPALAKTLGYNLPETGGRRRAFWDAVNAMFLLQNPLRPECWPPADESATGAAIVKSGNETETEPAETANGG